MTELIELRGVISVPLPLTYKQKSIFKIKEFEMTRHFSQVLDTRYVSSFRLYVYVSSLFHVLSWSMFILGPQL